MCKTCHDITMLFCHKQCNCPKCVNLYQTFQCTDWLWEPPKAQQPDRALEQAVVDLFNSKLNVKT